MYQHNNNLSAFSHDVIFINQSTHVADKIKCEPKNQEPPLTFSRSLMVSFYFFSLLLLSKKLWDKLSEKREIVRFHKNGIISQGLPEGEFS